MIDIANLPITIKPNRSYVGPKYSVKYLGIVDGNMGILSRRMAMIPEYPKASGGSLRAAGSSLMNMAPEPRRASPMRAGTE